MNDSQSINGAGLLRHLPPESTALLERVAATAAQSDVRVYLVGGIVRDLILGRSSLDLDVAVEGEAIRLAHALARDLHLHVVTHMQFGTATLQDDELVLDLAGTRTEVYPHPGALPVVQSAGLGEDLHRRDFTINAMALSLNASDYGALRDPTGGLADLRQGIVRVIHDKSFQDDATRLQRACRYEQRFGFRLDAGTEALARRDVNMLSTISGERLRYELSRTFAEEQPEGALGRAGELGVLQSIHGTLDWSQELAQAFPLIRGHDVDRAAAYMAAMTAGRAEGDIVALAERLMFPREWLQAATDAKTLGDVLRGLNAPSLLRSQIFALLRGFSREAIAARLGLEGERLVRQRLDLYLSELSRVETELGGRDILALGVASGPIVGEALAALKSARLDGLASSRDQELAYVRAWLRDRQADAESPTSFGR